MKLSRAEQETTITFNGRMQRTLAKLAVERPDEVQHVKATPEGGETYIVPKGWVRVRASRILSEAQKAASLKAAEKARLSRSNTRRGDV